MYHLCYEDYQCKKGNARSLTPILHLCLVEAPASPEMTTLWGGVHTPTDSSYVSVARASSSSQAPCRSTHRSPFAYKGVEDLWDMIKEKKSARGTSSELVLYFQPVTPSQFDEIQGVREKIGKGVKMGHIADQELLILELMPGADHENACAMFGVCVSGALQQMGVNLRSDLRYTHSTTLTLNDGSSGEGDWGIRPSHRQSHFPTLMVEVERAQSLPDLRSKARWWLEQSGGQIKLVIIIRIHVGGDRYHLEQWELIGGVATRCQEIDIDLNTDSATGNPPLPLVLHFPKIFLRPPGANETDIIFTAADLLTWARYSKV